jgi:hypothetical protein
VSLSPGVGNLVGIHVRLVRILKGALAAFVYNFAELIAREKENACHTPSRNQHFLMDIPDTKYILHLTYMDP